MPKSPRSRGASRRSWRSPITVLKRRNNGLHNSSHQHKHRQSKTFMTTYYTVLALSLAFTACAAPEPGQPAEAVPVAPVLPALQVEPAVGIKVRNPRVSVQLAQ